MAGGKETPRQKMIGMMYLVLTALLAMNVSKDILNGFVIVNESLERSNHNMAANTVSVMDAFRNAAKSEPRAVPYVPKAEEVLKITTDLHDYIDKLKKEVVQQTEQKGSYKDSTSRDKDLEKGWSMWYMDKKDNYDDPTHLLIGDDESNPISTPNSAKELRSKLEEGAKKLKAIFEGMKKDPDKFKFFEDDYKAIQKKIESMVPKDPTRMEDGVKETWETQNFYHLPLAAVITNLTKIQSDVNNVEAELIQQIAAAPGKTAIKFDRLSAKVIAPSSYIQSGGKYTADIFLAASSSDMGGDKLTIYSGATYDSISKKCTGCDGTGLPIVGGLGKYEAGAGSPGEQKWGGVIRFKNPTGEFEYYPFTQSYMVAAPAASVSSDAMNVFYLGIDNPISVSAAGIAPSEITPSPSGPISIRPGGGPGKYIVTASALTAKGQFASINVMAKTKDGSKSQGTVNFRVKRIPDPVPTLGGYKNGEAVPKTVLKSAASIFAMKPEGFDLDVKYTVTKWKLQILSGGKVTQYTGNGGALSSDALSALGKIASGGVVVLDAQASAPDKTVRQLGGCIIYAK